MPGTVQPGKAKEKANQAQKKEVCFYEFYHGLSVHEFGSATPVNTDLDIHSC